MTTIMIPKKEYRELVETKLRYDYLRRIIEEDIFASPPIRDIREIIKSFGATEKYNQKFLKSLEKGLGRSSYFKK